MASIFKRSFSTIEKVLIAVLIVALLGAAYYFGVVKNVADTKAANEQALASLEDEIASQRSVNMLRTQMEAELGDLGSLSSLPVVATYDNVSNELAELNSILSKASAYDLKFSAPEKSGTTIRRVVSISFTTPNNESALNIIGELKNGPYRCEITDFSLTAKLLADGSVESVAGTMTVTYYETSIGAGNLNGVVEKTTE